MTNNLNPPCTNCVQLEAELARLRPIIDLLSAYEGLPEPIEIALDDLLDASFPIPIHSNATLEKYHDDQCQMTQAASGGGNPYAYACTCEESKL